MSGLSDDGVYRPSENKLSDLLKSKFPCMVTLPLAETFQAMNWNNTSNEDKEELLNWAPLKETLEEHQRRRCHKLDKMVRHLT